MESRRGDWLAALAAVGMATSACWLVARPFTGDPPAWPGLVVAAAMALALGAAWSTRPPGARDERVGPLRRGDVGALAGLATSLALAVVAWFVALPAAGRLPTWPLLVVVVPLVLLGASTGRHLTAPSPASWRATCWLAGLALVAVVPSVVVGAVPAGPVLATRGPAEVLAVRQGHAVVERHGPVQRLVRLDTSCFDQAPLGARFTSPDTVRLDLPEGEGTGDRDVPVTAEALVDRAASVAPC